MEGLSKAKTSSCNKCSLLIYKHTNSHSIIQVPSVLSSIATRHCYHSECPCGMLDWHWHGWFWSRTQDINFMFCKDLVLICESLCSVQSAEFFAIWFGQLADASVEELVLRLYVPTLSPEGRLISPALDIFGEKTSLTCKQQSVQLTWLLPCLNVKAWATSRWPVEEPSFLDSCGHSLLFHIFGS